MATAAQDIERLFQALGDRTRLRLLNVIGDDEICVCFFVEALSESQPKISRHLAYLRRAGIVATRRDGKWIHYRVAEPSNPVAAEIMRNLRQWMASDPEMQRDRARLVSACCAPEAPVQLRTAPKPARLAEAAS
ncbi:MAG: metalloregulator ArsR/SmtB family transcription factor [Blastocatellia bacterium]|jgi:ArsR family transcriptional regulator|nr:metalloregulator ArsR/SmtB family transcription factor [Blastocatellia bacterium]MBK6427523.1 metalloregulator ArsR/SmtB family transcription factor [Blastocatellia bacterium]